MANDCLGREWNRVKVLRLAEHWGGRQSSGGRRAPFFRSSPIAATARALPDNLRTPWVPQEGLLTTQRCVARTKSRKWASDGFTMTELLMAVLVSLVIVGIALPRVIPATRYYHLMAAVPAVTGAIQNTRYQAIMTGCPYQIAFTAGTTSYQVSTEGLSGSPPACAASFTSLGNAVPWSSSGDVSISTSITLQFSPNGTMTVVTTPSTVPATFSLTNNTSTETITVAGAGDVSVSP
jgi:prepilin-type N-terminal cleavage/methylation domain-containing protein